MSSKPPKIRHPSVHNFQDLTGKTFTRLKVLYYAGDISWYCRCECGTFKTVPTKQLNRKQTRSCGCLLSDVSKQVNRTHGKKNTRIYRIWTGMLNRCRNPNSKDYPRYGGKGIVVCWRWRKFENFYEDMGDPPSNKHSIDRKESTAGYCKSNCRWATPIEQACNRSDSVVVQIGDTIHNASEWDRISGSHPGTVARRVRIGLHPFGKAFNDRNDWKIIKRAAQKGTDA